MAALRVHNLVVDESDYIFTSREFIEGQFSNGLTIGIIPMHSGKGPFHTTGPTACISPLVE